MSRKYLSLLDAGGGSRKSQKLNKNLPEKVPRDDEKSDPSVVEKLLPEPAIKKRGRGRPCPVNVCLFGPLAGGGGGPKVIKVHHKVVPKWSQSYQKLISNGPKVVPKSSQNQPARPESDPGMDPRSQCYPSASS